MFTAEQKAALAAPLARENVKTRSQSGRALSYIEGWHAIAEANRIFDHDGWSLETIELKCVAEHERRIGQQQVPGWGVTYTCRVRINVHNGIVRDGCGAGHGIDRDLGQAHESALKEAETDATKRALRTFGYAFGLALYDREQAHVSDGGGQDVSAPPQSKISTGKPPGKSGSQFPASQVLAEAMIKEVRSITTTKKLWEWMDDPDNRRRLSTLTEADRATVREECSGRNKRLREEENRAA